MSPQPWWEVFVGKIEGIHIVTAANTILGLGQLDKGEDPEAYIDSVVASRGFVQSCVQGEEGSFNDPASPGRPGSYLWEQLADAIALLPGGSN